MTPSDRPRGAGRWHPATVAAVALSLTVCGFALSMPGPWRIGAPLGAFVAGALVALSAGPAALRRWLRWTLAAWLPVAVSLVLVHGLAFPEGRAVLARLGPLAVTAEGLAFAAAAAARWLAASGAVALVGALCRPAALVQAIEAAGLPGGLGHAIAAALVLLPSARRVAAEIRAAQRARGLAVDGSIVRRAASLAPLVVPLAVQLIIDGQDRAEAVAARGYRPGQRMTHARPLPDSAYQRRARRAMLAAAALAVAVRLWAAAA